MLMSTSDKENFWKRKVTLIYENDFSKTKAN